MSSYSNLWISTTCHTSASSVDEMYIFMVTLYNSHIHSFQLSLALAPFLSSPWLYPPCRPCDQGFRLNNLIPNFSLATITNSNLNCNHIFLVFLTVHQCLYYCHVVDMWQPCTPTSPPTI